MNAAWPGSATSGSALSSSLPRKAGNEGSLVAQRDHHDTCIDHAQRLRRADGHVDHASLYERTTIVDATADRAPPIMDRHYAPHGTAPVRACHFAGASNSAVEGSFSAFGMCW